MKKQGTFSLGTLVRFSSWYELHGPDRFEGRRNIFNGETKMMKPWTSIRVEPFEKRVRMDKGLNQLQVRVSEVEVCEQNSPVIDFFRIQYLKAKFITPDLERILCVVNRYSKMVQAFKHTYEFGCV
jgi:hypothetical protein